MPTVLDHALSYLRAGLSVVPIAPDGSKSPSTSWGPYKGLNGRLANEREARIWWLNGMQGIAIVCGVISGGLEVLDFDSGAAWEEFRELTDSQLPGLLDLLPQVQTPGGGRHVYYRVAKPSGNLKFARSALGKTIAETRGEGGYVLAPGCPAACHPTGGLYLHAAGPPIERTPLLSDLVASHRAAS